MDWWDSRGNRLICRDGRTNRQAIIANPSKIIAYWLNVGMMKKLSLAEKLLVLLLPTEAGPSGSIEISRWMLPRSK